MVGAPPRMRVSVATHPDRSAADGSVKPNAAADPVRGPPSPDRARHPLPRRQSGWAPNRPLPTRGRESRMTRSRDSLYLNDDEGRETLRLSSPTPRLIVVVVVIVVLRRPSRRRRRRRGRLRLRRRRRRGSRGRRRPDRRRDGRRRDGRRRRRRRRRRRWRRWRRIRRARRRRGRRFRRRLSWRWRWRRLSRRRRRRRWGLR
jgi:hypothetical protein